jgi:peptidoglycan/LPS O-acetylase OafA/YrhL
MESERIRPSTLGIDVLRGVAILLVVAYHSLGPVWGWYVPWSGWTRDFSGLSSFSALFFYLMSLGWVGVPLFFVISGFCIHYSFLRSPGFSAGQFF